MSSTMVCKVEGPWRYTFTMTLQVRHEGFWSVRVFFLLLRILCLAHPSFQELSYRCYIYMFSFLLSFDTTRYMLHCGMFRNQRLAPRRHDDNKSKLSLFSNSKPSFNVRLLFHHIPSLHQFQLLDFVRISDFIWAIQAISTQPEDVILLSALTNCSRTLTACAVVCSCPPC